jgi:hypothetical protein
MSGTTDTDMIDFLGKQGHFEFISNSDNLMASCELDIQNPPNWDSFEGDTFRDCVREAMQNG